MKDEILTYLEMCGRHGISLQRGMNFKAPPEQGIILMSRRANAPYSDELSPDESILTYEGHDVPKTARTPVPKPESTDGRRECWANWDEGACKGESLGFIGPM